MPPSAREPPSNPRHPVVIISHKHQFIYLKTIKTASTSIENALCSVCGPDDIITPAAKRFMKLRPGGKAQNYRLNHPSVPRRPLIRQLLGRPERYYHRSIGYYEHMPAWRVKQYIGDETWNRYYKFTFERNPWDRQASFYRFRKKGRKRHMSFEQFLSKKSRAHVDNWGIYTIDDEVCVDFLGDYGRLEDDFRRVCEHLDLPDLKLPAVNTTSDPHDKPAYRAYYTPSTRDRVRNWYANEIEWMGYRF